MDEISANLEKVNEQIKLAAEKANRSTDEITLIAVTKTFQYLISKFSILLVSESLVRIVIRRQVRRFHCYQVM